MIQSETLELLEWHRLCQHLSSFASTKLGTVAARHLIIPASKADSLELLAQTREICHLETTLDSGLSFEGIEDIGEFLERAEIGGMLQGAELLNIATTLAGARRVRRTIDNEEKFPVLTRLLAEVRTYPELEQKIYHCIEEPGNVADRASPKLGTIRSQMKGLREKIYQVLQSIMQRNANALQEQLITQRGDRFVVPVKAPQKDAIPGIVHDTSSTGATLYIEPNAIVESGNRLRQYRRQEQVEEEAILRDLSAKVAEVKPDLEQLLAIVTAIDLATARARYSQWLQANPPRFIEPDKEETITLRQLRHPLLEWQHQRENGGKVVPINVQIRPQLRVIAITGPNTGGKTVTLKTVGLAALMAKAGLFVPAREPVELPWFEQILADIGDEQSIEQSLSTFSGHIRRISRIIEAIDRTKIEGYSPCLILLDEVGAGTDPAEGSVLAIALLKYLADKVMLTIATTHYGELKGLKYQDSRFENASVEFDELTLSPTYRLLWGIPGRSNALTIALRLGLNSEIVDRARESMGKVAADIDRVIAELEQERKEQETKAKEASKLLEQTERFYTEVSEKASNLKERERDLKTIQEKAVAEAIDEAKAEIAKVIRQLQQGPQTAQNAQKATDALNQIAEGYLPRQEKRQAPPKGYHPQVGEKVKILSLDRTAEVIGIAEAEGELMVRFGIMKMSVPIADVESLDGKKPEPPAKTKAAPAPAAPAFPKTVPSVRTSQNTLDLRGSRVANAEVDIERAIAQTSASGYRVLWIVHGKGTGRLREGVQDFLQRHPQVERFELAPENEGGAGATVAYLI